MDKRLERLTGLHLLNIQECLDAYLELKKEPPPASSKGEN
jgi:hypothetical protein